jgi:hypothetical protein
VTLPLLSHENSGRRNKSTHPWEAVFNSSKAFASLVRDGVRVNVQGCLWRRMAHAFLSVLH